MKLNRNNIMLVVLLLLLLLFSICVLSKNTVIETINYGIEECIPENPKIANIYTDIGIINTMGNCIREFKAISSNPSMCDMNNIISQGNSEICSGGEYNLGVYI